MLFVIIHYLYMQLVLYILEVTSTVIFWPDVRYQSLIPILVCMGLGFFWLKWERFWLGFGSKLGIM